MGSLFNQFSQAIASRSATAPSTVNPTENGVGQIVTLENPVLKLMVRPDRGGRIDQLQDLSTGHEWLWHPPGYDPAQTGCLPLGSCFDDHWTGGWDEIFPNDCAEYFQGNALVDHGELWSQPWQVLQHSAGHLSLGLTCQTVPVRVEKTIQVHPEQPQATLQYRLQNLSEQTIPFLLKQHAAIAIAAGDEILLPDCDVEAAFLEFSRLIGQPGKTRFPKAIAHDGREIDLRSIPPAKSKLQEFYYCSDLAQGQCGIRSRRARSDFLLRFDTADFPYVWVFQSYGGWHDHYALVLEPATTMPYSLDLACRQRTVAILHPHETRRYSLTVELQPW